MQYTHDFGNTPQFLATLIGNFPPVLARAVVMSVLG
jgi:hypothetical protein